MFILGTYIQFAEVGNRRNGGCKYDLSVCFCFKMYNEDLVFLLDLESFFNTTIFSYLLHFYSSPQRLKKLSNGPNILPGQNLPSKCSTLAYSATVCFLHVILSQPLVRVPRGFKLSDCFAMS